MSQKVKDFLKKSKKEVDPVIENMLSCYMGSRFKEAVIHQIKIGGKRLRPAFVIFSCEVVGGKKKDALQAAASVEILHNYSLIIDDMIDHSDFRRGEPTVWKKWGVSTAECVAMHYAATIFRGTRDTPHPVEVNSILTEALQVLTEGEMIDVLQEIRGREDEYFIEKNRYKNVKIEDALLMAEKKTARLFEASCNLGGVCGGGSTEDIKKLKEYGFNLGMAFQIQDDVLDIFGEEEKFGKKIGKDIEERKGGNIVVLFALEEVESDSLLEIINKKDLNDDDLLKAKEIISETKAKKKAVDLAEQYMKKSQNAVLHFKKEKEAGIMKEMVDFMLKRKV